MLAWLLQFKEVGVSVFQARAYIINLLLLSLSLSNFALANGVNEEGLPHLTPDLQRRAQEAVGGRPVAYGQQGQGFGQQQALGIASQVRPKFQKLLQNNSPQVIQQLDQMVEQVNTEQEEPRHSQLKAELRNWLSQRTGQQVTDKMLHQLYCVDPRGLVKPNPNGDKPGSDAKDGQGNKAGTQADDADSASRPDLVSPISRLERPVLDVAVLEREVAPTAVRAEWVRRQTARTGEAPPTPARRSAMNPTGTKIPEGETEYDGEGCIRPNNLGQTLPQGEAANNPNNNNSGDSTGGSPSDDKQPPNAGAGGAGYASKNQGVKPPNIPDPSPYGQMPGSSQIDGSCMFCSAIAEAGKSKYQYNGAATVQGIGKDLDAQKAQRDEIMAKSSFMPPRALPMGNQRPTTRDALSSAGKKGAVNPLSLMPNL